MPCSFCKMPILNSYFKDKKYAFCSFECYLKYMYKLANKKHLPIKTVAEILRSKKPNENLIATFFDLISP